MEQTNEQTTQVRELTRSEKIYLGSNEITKRIKKGLKQKYPNCTFSVRKQEYSGGWSIHLSLMKSDFKVIRDPETITEENIHYLGRGYSLEDIRNRQRERYHQLNHWFIRDYSPNEWCNGVFLTEKGHNMLREAVKITNQYNWDNSDPMVDYFDVNFYLHLNLGKWDKPFIDGESD